MRTIKNFAHIILGCIAAVSYARPANGMTVIGVTGTDGKTTTSHMIYSILKEDGRNVAMISTLGAVIDGKKYENGLHVTTPSAFTLQRYIKLAKKNKATHLVLEITSHGLDQHRDLGIVYEVGVLTNISHEHLDYHKTFENYAETKLKLIRKAKFGIINKDDASYPFLHSKTQDIGSRIITYGFDDADVSLREFPVSQFFDEDFNQHNALAAAGVGKTLGIGTDVIMQGLKKYHKPVGRQEIVHNGKITVMVDFAHTPNAFLMLLKDIAANKKGRLIHVFGSAGARDHTKRPEMGKFSSKFSDVVILTSEDPRNEKTDSIYREIEKGFNKKFTRSRSDNDLKNKSNVYTTVDDRETAIEKAINIARPGDFVVITGKAHEKSMNFNGVERPWDEFAAVKKALKKYGYE